MDALVIGSGISGMSMYWALRNAGMKVKIFDSSNTFESGGFITLWPNAIKSFQKLGFGDEIINNSLSKDSSMILNHRGKKITQVPIYKIREATGIPVLSISRGVLYDILGLQIPSEDYFTKKTCCHYECTGDDTIMHFEDGSSYVTDLVVAADGINSVIREQMFGKQPLRYAGRFSWNGVYKGNDFELEKSRVYEIQGRGKRIGFTALPNGEIGWYANINLPESFVIPKDNKSFLKEEFKGWPLESEKLFEGTEDRYIKVFKIQDREPIKSWRSCKIILAGDAAHPMTPDAGQGACQSVEDAAILGILLKRSPSIEIALHEYEKMRIPRVNHLINYSRKIGGFSNWKSPLMVKLRELMFKVMPGDQLVAPFIKIVNINFPGE